MSMHLVGPHLTTTSTKKRQEKITKAKQAELESGWRERNDRLKGMGLPKETFEQYLVWVYGKGKKETKKKDTLKTSLPGIQANSGKQDGTTSGYTKSTATLPVSTNGVLFGQSDEKVRGACSSKPSPTYTGSKVIGIAVMHKSCLQPIFSEEEAKDSAKMRR